MRVLPFINNKEYIVFAKNIYPGCWEVLVRVFGRKFIYTVNATDGFDAVMQVLGLFEEQAC